MDYFSYVVIPDIKRVSNAQKLRNDKDEPYEPLLTIDGEAVILNNLLLPELQHAFNEEFINVVKVVPSGTAKHNACENTGLRFLESTPSRNYKTQLLTSSLKKIFATLKTDRQ